MVSINLTNKTISLRLSGDREVTLAFESDAAYFYLLFVALVAREMKKLTSKGNDKPFVPIRNVKNETWLLANALNRPFRTIQTMVDTIYSSWPDRLIWSGHGQCLWQPYSKLTAEEKEELSEPSELFGRKKGNRGLNAEYRINRAVNTIRVKDPEVLENLVRNAGTGDELANAARLPHYVPRKPYYSGLTCHEKLIKNSLEAMKQGPAGQFLQIWGMGGLGKSTVAAEIARRYTNDNHKHGVFWVQLQTFSSKTLSEVKPLRAQIADNLLAQLGLLDRLNEPLKAKLLEVTRDETLSQSLLVIDNFDPVHHRIDDLVTILEEIQPKCVIITSRPSLDIQHCCKIKTPPLGRKDGVRFLQTDAERRDIASALPKSQDALNEMCKVTGGLPFAMQLALGQATRLPWHTVIQRCASGQTELYYYLFRDSWRILDSVAQKVLIYMRTSPDGVDFDELTRAEDIGSSSQIIAAIDELVKLALIDIRHLDESSASYSIHPLTYNFIMTDLPRVWSEEDAK